MSRGNYKMYTEEIMSAIFTKKGNKLTGFVLYIFNITTCTSNHQQILNLNILKVIN